MSKRYIGEQGCYFCGKWLRTTAEDEGCYVVCNNKKCQEKSQEEVKPMTDTKPESITIHNYISKEKIKSINDGARLEERERIRTELEDLFNDGDLHFITFDKLLKILGGWK